MDTLIESYIRKLQGTQFDFIRPMEGDFPWDYVFEVGGKNKTRRQIADTPNAFVVKDEIEYGSANSIPLWLFGFLF